jgi:hypothetical protein
MPIAEAAIVTPRAARYVTQFGKHAEAMAAGRGHVHGARDEVDLHVEHTDDEVVVTFDPWGRATLRARDGRLTVRAEAADQQNLARIQEILTRNVERFGRRDQLTLTWDGSEPPRPRTRGPIVLTAAGALAAAGAVAVHLGVGAGALALGGATAAVAAVALLAGHAAIPLAALRLRHRFHGRKQPIRPVQRGGLDDQVAG